MTVSHPGSTQPMSFNGSINLVCLGEKLRIVKHWFYFMPAETTARREYPYLPFALFLCLLCSLLSLLELAASAVGMLRARSRIRSISMSAASIRLTYNLHAFSLSKSRLVSSARSDHLLLNLLPSSSTRLSLYSSGSSMPLLSRSPQRICWLPLHLSQRSTLMNPQTGVQENSKVGNRHSCLQKQVYCP